MEANDLNFMRLNQTALRIDQYQWLMDHVQNFALANQVPVGRMFFLHQVIGLIQ